MSETLDVEVELLSSGLLPSETLEQEERPQTSCSPPSRVISVSNADSGRKLVVGVVPDGYPALSAVNVALKGESMDRDEAHRAAAQVKDLLERNWDDSEEYPLYQIMTTHLLPLIAPSTSGPDDSTATTSAAAERERSSAKSADDEPCHALLTSHHLLSKTKRKDFIALASQLSLTGFSKVGHPGIYYAMGTEGNLKEWLKEVKSWNWLNLRVRVGIEPIPAEYEERSTVQDESRGKADGARGGLGRGNWVELEKISDALTWMRDRGREAMLTDIGIGA